jgi:hypothetical protein
MNVKELVAVELAKCSNATRDSAYIPQSVIGRLMIIAMEAEREIRTLEAENEELRQKLAGA